MVHYCPMARYHGSHCRLESFPTKCPRCHSPVIFWQCTHGCKIFFEYPIYGRALKHICKLNPKRSHNRSSISHGNYIIKLTERSTYRCPVCQRILGTEDALLEHIRRLKRSDESHAYFFGEVLDLIDFDSQATEILEQTEKIDISNEIFDLSKDTPNLGRFKTGHHLPDTKSLIIKKKSGKKIDE